MHRFPSFHLLQELTVTINHELQGHPTFIHVHAHVC